MTLLLYVKQHKYNTSHNISIIIIQILEKMPGSKAIFKEYFTCNRENVQ